MNEGERERWTGGAEGANGMVMVIKRHRDLCSAAKINPTYLQSIFGVIDNRIPKLLWAVYNSWVSSIVLLLHTSDRLSLSQ
jgi:hypothetical protein